MESAYAINVLVLVLMHILLVSVAQQVLKKLDPHVTIQQPHPTLAHQEEACLEVHVLYLELTIVHLGVAYLEAHALFLLQEDILAHRVAHYLEAHVQFLLDLLTTAPLVVVYLAQPVQLL